jgi:hypothetical protein
VYDINLRYRAGKEIDDDSLSRIPLASSFPDSYILLSDVVKALLFSEVQVNFQP